MDDLFNNVDDGILDFNLENLILSKEATSFFRQKFFSLRFKMTLLFEIFAFFLVDFEIQISRLMHFDTF